MFYRRVGRLESGSYFFILCGNDEDEGRVESYSITWEVLKGFFFVGRC